MDYEKKYKEALEWMREMYPCLTGSMREDAEHFFPELAESEDERIRKMLIEQMGRWHECALENNVVQDIKDSADAISYLEKQKDVETEIEKAYKNADQVQYRKGYEDGVASVKPAEWSKEDEKMILDTIRILQTASPVPQSNGKVALRFSENILWLKSLHRRFVKEDEK